MVVGYRPSIHLIVVGVSWDPHTSQVFFKLPDVPILALASRLEAIASRSIHNCLWSSICGSISVSFVLVNNHLTDSLLMGLH